MRQENIKKEGKVYKKSGILKNWGQRYLVVTHDKLYYYSHHKNERPKKVEEINSLTCTVGEAKKDFYVFKLKIPEKKSLTIGVKSKEELDQWTACFTHTESESEEDQEVHQEAHQEPQEEGPRPKWAEESLEAFKKIQNWKLVSDQCWCSGNWLKQVQLVEAPSALVVEFIQHKRASWDWCFSGQRTVSTFGNWLVSYSEGRTKKFVLFSGSFAIPPFETFLVQNTVKHLHYPTELDFTEYYLVSQHPYEAYKTLVTRVTNTTMFKASFGSLKAALDIVQFQASASDNALSLELEHKPSTETFSFKDFFVYGKGGRYERDEINGGLILNDKELISFQRGVLKHLIKSMGRNLLSGKSVMNISLPVNIFEPKSLLQRLCEMFGYAPIFLEKASESQGLERFNQVLAFMVSMLHMSTEQKKPFNPILGETLQTQLGSCKLYAEQTSHHPPVANFQVYGENWKMYGYHEFTAATSANSVKARQKGLIKIVIDDVEYIASLPYAMITGTLMGKRYYNWSGVLTLIDTKNRLFSELQFNPDKKGAISGLFSKASSQQDYFKGTIQKVSSSHVSMTSEGINSILADGKKPVSPHEQDIEEEISFVEGYWPLYLEVSGVKYWDFDDYRPYKLTSSDNLLPSDSAHRKDLIALLEGNENEAQREKEVLENIQRNDRKLREQYAKSKKP